MYVIPIREIPRDTSLVVEVEMERAEVEEMFADLPDFSLAPGAKLEAKIRTQRVGDSIRVAGYAGARVRFVCGRCLEERELELECEPEYMLLSRDEFLKRYDESMAAPSSQDDDEDHEGGYQLSSDDLDVHYYEGDTIDLRPFIKESLLLELPIYAVCPEELQPLCDAAYKANVGEKALQENEEAALDPRWSKLLELKKKQESN